MTIGERSEIKKDFADIIGFRLQCWSTRRLPSTRSIRKSDREGTRYFMLIIVRDADFGGRAYFYLNRRVQIEK